jgi:hypothetical protein
MGVAEDFLALAGRLADPAPTDPEQASLRRSVATAYYALFHLLVQEAVLGWNGTLEVRASLERRFEHKNMRTVSDAIARNRWQAWSASSPPLPSELRAVARAFVELQEARVLADYDNSKNWTSSEVETKVALAQTAFRDWTSIRSHPVANEYLLSLLVGKRKE